MASVYRHSTTLAAIGVAVLLIAGAYLLAKGEGGARPAQASSETALLQAIATRDSNGDGLPDWEKSLYGIPIANSTTTDYFHLGMTDGEAVAKGLIVPVALTPAAPSIPADSAGGTTMEGGVAAAPVGTLTDAFGKNFFTLYVQAKEANGGAALSSDQTAALAQQVLQQLTSSITPAPDFKTAADITVSGAGSDALKAYAANAEAIFTKQTAAAPKGELDYLQDLINDDQSAATHLQTIAAAYMAGAQGMAALPVPQEMAATHLKMVNALARIASITLDFSHLETDPIAAMFALQQYPQALLDMGNAFISIGQIYAAAGVTLAPGTPGAAFVNVASDLSKSQQTTP